MRSIFMTILSLLWLGFIVYWLMAARPTFFEAIIPVCWSIFILYWLITARRVKAIAEKQSLASALAHRIPVGMAWFFLVDWKLPYLNMVLISRAEWMLMAGNVICVMGLLATLWARWTLAGNWSSDVTFKEGHELIENGPYRFVRHPIYTGLLIMCVGTAIEIGRLRGILGLAVMTLGFWIKLKQEERLLMRHFPEEYPAYSKRVKALVPYVL